jgi:hypothetical protein
MLGHGRGSPLPMSWNVMSRTRARTSPS